MEFRQIPRQDRPGKFKIMWERFELFFQRSNPFSEELEIFQRVGIVSKRVDLLTVLICDLRMVKYRAFGRFCQIDAEKNLFQVEKISLTDGPFFRLDKQEVPAGRAGLVAVRQSAAV